jgi:hypothetical protein
MTYKVTDSGSFYTVAISAADVRDFADTWPCAGFSDNPVTFEFDRRNGDLMDSNDQEMHPNADGGAMVALSDDAMRVGESRLGLFLNR